MMDEIVQMFSYSFMIRAFITGIFISLCASLIGVNLVLKHYSMMGDGLSPCSLWRIGTVRCFKKISYNLFSAGSHIMRIFSSFYIQ